MLKHYTLYAHEHIHDILTHEAQYFAHMHMKDTHNTHVHEALTLHTCA